MVSESVQYLTMRRQNSKHQTSETSHEVSSVLTYTYLVIPPREYAIDVPYFIMTTQWEGGRNTLARQPCHVACPYPPIVFEIL